MTPAEKAAANFKAYDTAMIQHLFRGAAEPKGADYGYRHGWVVVEGRSFCREELFPNEHHPRFPADQGVSD